MLKSAFIGAVLCSALACGCTSVPTEESVRAPKSVSLRDMLQAFKGKKCRTVAEGPAWVLVFGGKGEAEANMDAKLVSVGRDFIRVTRESGTVCIPLSAIRGIWID